MITRLLLAASLLVSTNALAHSVSDSFVRLDRSSVGITGTWDIALTDLEAAVGLDVDHDGNITWGELKARRSAIEAYAMPHLVVTPEGSNACAVRYLERACMMRVTATEVRIF